MSEWSKVPPTEPGWYWYKERGKYDAQIVHYLPSQYRGGQLDCVYFTNEQGYEIMQELTGEWWTTPIPKPGN